MEIPIPAWFKYRQGVVEAAGENTFKVSAPVSEPAVIRIRQVYGKWQAAIADSVGGPDLRATEPEFSRPIDAWNAAFELYRTLRIM
jgi:hypothetical protein